MWPYIQEDQQAGRAGCSRGVRSAPSWGPGTMYVSRPYPGPDVGWRILEPLMNSCDMAVHVLAELWKRKGRETS